MKEIKAWEVEEDIEFNILQLHRTNEVEFDGWDDQEVDENHISLKFEKFLIAINVVIFFIIGSINDFDLQAFGIIVFMIALFVINCFIIKKFGKIFN